MQIKRITKKAQYNDNHSHEKEGKASLMKALSIHGETMYNIQHWIIFRLFLYFKYV